MRWEAIRIERRGGGGGEISERDGDSEKRDAIARGDAGGIDVSAITGEDTAPSSEKKREANRDGGG